MTAMAPQDYVEFLGQIKAQIRQRQLQALRAVNHERGGLYWNLGESIHRKPLAQGWGKSVVQNLWLMLPFFREYSEQPKRQQWIREIT